MENIDSDSRNLSDNQINNIQPGEQQKPQPPKKRDSFFYGILTGMLLAFLVLSAAIIIDNSQKAKRIQGNQINQEAGNEIGSNQEAGTNQGQTATDVAGQGALVINEDSAINSLTIRKLQTLESTIKQYFFLDEKSQEELENGLYEGLMQSLQDPYSEYYTQAELVELMNHVSGVYNGIGAYVSIDPTSSLPKISGVIPGTPAESIGLRENDIIYKVDEHLTYGLTLTQAVSYIRGEEGSEVELTIIREGESDYLTFQTIRKKVESPTIQYEMLEDDMGYIQIIEFDDVTTNQFAQALTELKSLGMKSLILDLRGNPGGGFNVVIDIAKMLLPEGLVVYTEDKNGQRKDYTCDGTQEIDIPMAVLVDMNSASASEILAGAIQDHEKGTLVGTTTYGKGIVQQVFGFPDGSAVKITVSSYLTPKGRDIHGVGITPDVICEFDGEAYYGSEDHPDNQLEKAKEILRNE